MNILKKIREIMVPLDNAAVATVDTPLREIIPALRSLYCEIETGACTEAGPRAIMVLDEDRRAVGFVDFQCIINVFIAEIAGNILTKVRALWDLLGAVTLFGPIDETKVDLAARITKNAEKRVGDFMVRTETTISADADLLEAIMVLGQNHVSILPVYDNDRLVGVVRDADLFIAIAEMMDERAMGYLGNRSPDSIPKYTWSRA